jgi:hypothetical protein
MDGRHCGKWSIPVTTVVTDKKQYSKTQMSKPNGLFSAFYESATVQDIFPTNPTEVG